MLPSSLKSPSEISPLVAPDSNIDHLLHGKVAGAVAEVAGNEETSAILRARSRQDEVKITVLVQIVTWMLLHWS
jgi:hypothetical protein